jgi:hypothetical protein
MLCHANVVLLSGNTLRQRLDSSPRTEYAPSMAIGLNRIKPSIWQWTD